MSFREWLSEAKVAKVPKEFKSTKDMVKFINSLNPNAKLSGDIVDPETGEVIMWRGETRRKVLKRDFKRFDDYDLTGDVMFLDYPEDEDTFKEYFYVIEKPISKIVDLPHDEHDYDLSMVIPSKIKRKDGKAFTSEDKDSIADYIKFKGKHLGNMKITTFYKKNIVEFNIEFQ